MRIIHSDLHDSPIMYHHFMVWLVYYEDVIYIQYNNCGIVNKEKTRLYNKEITG